MATMVIRRSYKDSAGIVFPVAGTSIEFAFLFCKLFLLLIPIIFSLFFCHYAYASL